MNSVILFVSHTINDKIVKRFKKIKKDVKELNYDVIFCCPISLDITGYNLSNVYRYNNYIVVYSNYLNPSKIMEKFYDENKNKYDYYYITEYDVEFNGNWSVLFSELDKHNEDLIGVYTESKQKLDNENRKYDYFCFHQFKELMELNEQPMYYKGCYSFYRISDKALKFICESKNLLLDYIYEVYLPTLLINNGFTYIDLNKSYVETDFEGLDFISDKYYCNVLIRSDDEMTMENKLYTRYKI